ncbi:MAG: hypothetical protein WEB78_03485, partial [Ilumatobacteraceae bacterium]
SSDVTTAAVELSPLTTTAVTTVPAATPVAPAATTTAPAPVTTMAVPTTAQVTTTVAATTTVGAAPIPPCDLDLIVQETETTYEGITPTDLRCADVWATWVGKPDDPMADGFFAVAKWDTGTWVLVNLGSAEICGDGGVPAELWDALNCIE